MNNFKEKLLSGTYYNCAGYIGNAVIGFFIYRMIINLLAVYDYGNYKTFMITVDLCVFFFSFGTANSMLRYLAELDQSKYYNLLKKLFSNVLFFQTITISIGIIILYLARDFYISSLKLINVDKCIPFLLLMIFLQNGNHSAYCALDAFLMQKQRNINEIICMIFRLLLLLILFQYKANLLNLMIAISISCIIWLFLNYFALIKKIISYPVNADEPVYKNFYTKFRRFSFFTYFDQIGEHVLSINFDIYIVSFILGVEKTGLYSFAVGTVIMIYKMLPINMASAVIKTIIIKKYTENNDKNMLSFFFKSYLKLNYFFIVPIIWGGIFLGPSIIQIIFKKEYLESYSVFVLSLISFGCFFAFRYPLTALIEVLEKAEISFYSKIFIIFNVVIGIILTKKIGINGPIIATGLTYLFTVIMQVFMLKKLAPLNLSILSLIKINFNALIMIFAMYVLKIYLPITNLFYLILFIVIGTITYFGAAAINKNFTSAEQDFINLVFKKKIFIF